MDFKIENDRISITNGEIDTAKNIILFADAIAYAKPGDIKTNPRLGIDIVSFTQESSSRYFSIIRTISKNYQILNLTIKTMQVQQNSITLSFEEIDELATIEL